MVHSPLIRSIFVGVSTLIGCGVALSTLYMSIVSEAFGALTALLSILSSDGSRRPTPYWQPLLLAGIAVLIALAINMWSLWWSKLPPRGAHFGFNLFALTATLVTLACTLYIGYSVVAMHHPGLYGQSSADAAAREREETRALAAENAREEAQRLEMEERNAKIDRERSRQKR
jgi:hypothetical protein